MVSDWPHLFELLPMGPVLVFFIVLAAVELGIASVWGADE